MHCELLAYYGEPGRKTQRDPLSELVLTILSQNTSDTNSGRAYRSLREQYADWQDLLTAPTEEVAAAIRVGGLANVKAPRIQNILERLHQERGQLDLGFLEAMSLDEARSYLLDLPGVGPKTAACVLLFSLGRPALPVDTHVHRVAQRVGLIPESASAEKAHGMLEALLPEEGYYPFHLLMIRHGRTLCKASSPLCEQCPLAARCLYYHAQLEAAGDADKGAAAEP
ncbi:MAG: endonuclease III [Anaerolineae bacterium]|nr:endonuclease III [Anaerolineae bacterium]